MYLISAYFDEHVTKGLQRLIDNIAKETGNTYMIENNVPPHLTISSFETRKPDNLKEEFMKLNKIGAGEIYIFNRAVSAVCYVCYTCSGRIFNASFQ